jgi:hypothetical protein
VKFARLLLSILLILVLQLCYSQKTSAFISGKVLDENDHPLSNVSIVILGKQTGLVTSDSGTFRIKVPADRAFALVFSFTGYKDEQRNFLLNAGEEETIVVRMERGAKQLKEVVVMDERERREAGLVRVNPKSAINLPTPVGGIEGLIKVIVGSNNELTSQYSVRGGNYDENLVYVNDYEIFRPYLVRSGQQEGLSFINPELTRNVSFYTGGFQAKYGDKMSSALDIQYRKPKSFAGSAYIGLLEQGLHLEGVSKNNRFTYLVGVRNRTNKNLFSSQETKGNYVPSSADLQALLTYQLNNKWSLELFGNISQTKFTLIPEFSQLSSAVFTPYFTANLGLDVYFDGREEDRYQTNMVGVTAYQQVKKNLRLKWMLSRLEDNEKESIDITGAYLFGEREFDKSKADFGLITNPLGAGVDQNFARNKLNIVVWDFAHKGYLEEGKHYIQWGANFDQQLVDDRLNEWEMQDSAGYVIPYNPNQLELTKVIKSTANLNIGRFSGYVQDNILLRDSTGAAIQAGIRYNYNTLNHEFLVSPRVGISWRPMQWNKDVIFKASTGLYMQPPFYRELRRYDGTINEDLLAQKSWQVVAGMDYNFKSGDRPFRFTTEAYYKYMWDVVPYDIDNVRIRYFGENMAKAFATGIEFRLFGELVKDAESWISLGFMKTMEDLKNDYYYNYSIDTAGNKLDSTLTQNGWLRRPTDRLFTLGVYLQDYLTTNKNFKVYLNMIYGSNMPYNIPGSIKYRNALIIDPYIRVDMGFSVLLLDSEKSNRRSHSPTRSFENIWATLEIFNIIDRANTISYQLIKDFSNTVFAMPNRLTPRLVNLKLVARF